MEKIDVSFYDGFQPIVNVHLRKLFDYINTAKEGNELNIYGTRMAKITDDNSKTYEMLYLNQNDFWQLRAIWKQKECCFKLSIFSRTSHRNIQIAKAYTVDDAEYQWLVWSKQIYNTCIMNNENMLCFDRLRWAILMQAFDDYRLSNNHLIRVKEALSADLKTLELSDQKRRALMNQRESATYRMGQIRKELREINPKYVDMLPKLSLKRYSYISELLGEVSN